MSRNRNTYICPICSNSFQRYASQVQTKRPPCCSQECSYKERTSSIKDRFWPKVDTSAGPSGCWPWIAGFYPAGYGQFYPGGGGRSIGAHRVAYELMVGPIPEGLVIDHLCRNRACVNPAHLEAVTYYENVARGEQPSMVYHRTNRCKRGHEFTPENTIKRINPSGRPGRSCKACRSENRKRKYRERRRQQGK